MNSISQGGIAWVALMRDDPFYAAISGFHADHVPGVGTFPGQDRL
jgi:hypothetical protein